MDRLRVGRQRKQSPCPLLSAHDDGTEAAQHGAAELEENHQRGRSRAGVLVTTNGRGRQWLGCLGYGHSSEEKSWHGSKTKSLRSTLRCVSNSMLSRECRRRRLAVMRGSVSGVQPCGESG